MEIILSNTPRLLHDKLQNRIAPPASPELEQMKAAVLFCDIAGFSKLTEKVVGSGDDGISRLVKILDSYISLMVDIILDHDGDVVKFAGDALFCVWPVSERNDLPSVLAQALRCAMELQTKINNYETEDATIDARIALGGGSFTLYHVGGIFGRWELLMAGDAMNQASRAGRIALAGEVVIAEEAYELLKQMELLDPLVDKKDRGETGSVVIEHEEEEIPIHCQVKPIEQPYTFEPTVQVHARAIYALRAYIPRAILTEMNEKKGARLVDYRPVSVIFLKVINFDSEKTYDIEYVNNVMQIMQRCLYQFEGSINRFGLDDKGAVLLAAFGLPPLLHDDDPVRAVKAAFKFRDLFRKNGLQCVIGIGTGPVFCGMVGSQRRSEYTMHGTIVNLTAALMQASSSILCDETTYEATKRDFDFKEAAPVKIKSQPEPIPAFEPQFYTGLDPWEN